jgi:hypothetical protein
MTLPTIQHPYYSNHQVSGHYLKGTDHDTYILINSTVIEDDDLTFDGKKLSTWYEEERRRQLWWCRWQREMKRMRASEGY